MKHVKVNRYRCLSPTSVARLKEARMTKRMRSLLNFLGAVAIVLAGCQEPGETNGGSEGPPYSPEEALETFELPPGFRIELVAAEPEVTDPVDLAFDADGRLYVAEMPDYPAEEGKPPTSKIKLLEDRNGDGRFETSTVFAEDLPFVNGVMPWRDGVLVTRAPDIMYFEDTDGDGRADVRRVILTGFAATNPQLRMSSLEYGIDNWIYGAYSRAGGARRYPQFADEGSPLTFPNSPEKDSVDIYPGTDFRFRPGEHVVEPAGGMSQFGNAFDAAGNRFTVWNSRHIRHVVIPHQYLTRNPYLSVSSVMASIPDHGDAATIYPITENPLHLHESEIGHFTSACGTSIYTGGQFPEGYRHNAYVCEPVHNLVHTDLLEANGGTFSASRPRAEKEFLASTDRWFRPVNTTVGPDGALYIADFYRKLVEHPTFIARADSEGLYTYSGKLTESDFLEGRDKGRIYRVVPEEFQAEEKPRLSNASNEELVDKLSHPNKWWRTTAQRLLVGQQDQSVVALLAETAGQAQSAQGRMHALWTLDGLGSLDEELVLKALDDESPLVRKQAVRLAEQHLSSPDIRGELVRMADDPDSHVQFQLALTLGNLSTDESFEALKQIAFRHIEDTWFRTAVLTSASTNALQWYRAASEHPDFAASESDGKSQFLRQAASIIGAKQNEGNVADVLTDIGQGSGKSRQEQNASLKGLAEGLDRGADTAIELSEAGQRPLVDLINTSPELQKAALDVAAHIKLRNTSQLRAAVQQASEVAFNEEAPVEARVNATRILGLNPTDSTLSDLEQLLSPQYQDDLRVAAATVLVKMDHADAISTLLERWETYTAPVKDVVEDGIMSRTDRVFALLSAIEAGEIEPTWVSRRRRAQLMQFPNDEISSRAENLFSDLSTGNREDVIREYHPAIQMDGNIEEGRAVFEEQCATCHKVGDVGYEVGPDVASLTNRTQIDLMTQILDPNDNIAPGYEMYVVETTAGETFSGVMANESASSILMRSAEGIEHSILRSNIEAIRPSPVSLMPAGLESSISVDRMADLLAYLQNIE